MKYRFCFYGWIDVGDVEAVDNVDADVVEALANVDEFDTRVALPLDFGDVGAVVLRWPEAIDRAEDEAKGRPLDAEDDPRPRLEVTLIVFAEFDIFCVRQTEK